MSEAILRPRLSKQMLDWNWSFELSDDALWVAFSGKDTQGNILDGTPVDLPYRLDRVQ